MSLWSRLRSGYRQRRLESRYKRAQADLRRSIDALPPKLRARADGFYNLSTGMGVEGRDVTIETVFTRSRVLDVEELDAMYHGNDLFRRVTDRLPTEAMRRGYTIAVLDQGTDKRRKAEVNSDASTAINGLHSDLKVPDRLLAGAIWGRLHGGAIVVMGIDDKQETDKPVNEKAIQGIRYLDVVQRPQVTIHSWYSDRKLPSFGQPEVYKVIPLAKGRGGRIEPYLVHESRCVVFGGARTSEQFKVENQGFDHSVLQAPWDVLKANGTIWQFAALMLQVNGVGVLKVSQLAQQMSNTTGATDLQSRIEEINFTSSVMRTIALHESEDYSRVPVPLGGLSDMVSSFKSRAAAAADMDEYELWGTLPSGLSITPESRRAWYDRVQTCREHFMQPAIEKVTRYLFLSAEGPTQGKIPEAWEVRFPPLWQPTEGEKALTRKATAEADSIEIHAKVVKPEEVTVMRHGPEADDPVDLTARYEALLPDVDEETGTEEAVDPSTALNGAQVTSLVQVVQLVASGELPRETGVAIITACFPLSPEQADAVMGPVGKGFEPPPPEPAPAPFGGPPDPPPENEPPAPVPG